MTSILASPRLQKQSGSPTLSRYDFLFSLSSILFVACFKILHGEAERESHPSNASSVSPARLPLVYLKNLFDASAFLICFHPSPCSPTAPIAGLSGATEHHLQPAPAAGQQGARHRAQRLPVQEERRVGAQIIAYDFVFFLSVLVLLFCKVGFVHPGQQLKMI